MALATQCPHCYTTFRVANDQLKLHAGLVRCGACQQTFNGVEHLLAPGATPAALPVSIPAAQSAESPAVTAAEPVIPAPAEAYAEAQVQDAADITPLPAIQDETMHPDLNAIGDGNAIKAGAGSALDFDLGENEAFIQETAVQAHSTPAVQPDDNNDEAAALPTQLMHLDDEQSTASESETGIAPGDSRQEPVFGEPPDTGIVTGEDTSTIEEEPTAAGPESPAVPDTDASETAADADSEEEKPTFVVQAEKKQRRSRLVRAVMIISSILLFSALLAQTTYSLRNQLAAWFPQMKSTLQQACKPLKCSIALPMQIETISIEANELQALSTDKNIFSLSIQLQNKGGTLQAWPMLELILNDAKDKPVLKRVFTPADYLANKNDLLKGFAPDSEQTIKLYFELSGAKAAGYHVGVFYP